MAGKQRQVRIQDPLTERLNERFDPPARSMPDRTMSIEHAIKPELMHFDLHGQRARDLEIIRLLNEISSKLDGK